MFKSKNNTPNLEFNSGSQQEFLDFNEFREFENNMIFDIIDSPTEYQIKKWINERADSKLLFRPKDFYGTIKNISVQEMEDPIERIINRQEDGFTMLTNYIIHPGAQLDRLLEHSGDRMKGFYFIADAMRTGQGKIGQIIAEEWFVPRPDRLEKELMHSKDELLHRYITRPMILNPEISNMEISNAEKFAIYRDLGKKALQNISNKKYFNY